MVTENESLSSVESNKQKFFYGYIVAIAAFIILTLSFGINLSFGVFFEPMLAELGWTRAVTSGAFSLGTLVYGFLSIFAGRLSDRFGARIISMSFCVLFSLSILSLSQINSVWQLYLYWGVMEGIGLSGAWAPLTSTITRWFIKRRGLMTGLVTAGVGFGTLLISPLANKLISIYNWRSASLIIGTAVLIIFIIASWLLKNPPREMTQSAHEENEIMLFPYQAKELSFREIIHTWQFWIIGVVYFFFAYSFLAIMVHIAIYATGLGVSPASAANILAIIGGLGFIGRIIIGIATDRLGAKFSFLIALILTSVALIWLQVARELWMLYLFAVIFGFAWGGVSALGPLTLAELFGLSSLGILVGSVTFMYTIGGAIGPVLSGYIFDKAGNYSLAFLICAAVSIISLMLIISLKPLKKAKG